MEKYKSPRIVALEIDEFDEHSGLDGIALVESPAIEEDFYFFSNQKFETYNDYPQAASDNACKVLRWIEEHGRDEVSGMTRVGITRANQLCSRENISEETIARMASFARHKGNAEIDEEYKGTPWKDKGYVAWLGWGGDEGISWAQRKLEQIRRVENDVDVSGLDNYLPTGSDIIPKDVFVEHTELNIFGYNTQYFFICPGAVATFTHLMEMNPDEDTRGMIRSAAQIADNIFRIEHEVITNGSADLEELGEANVLLDDFYDLMKEIDELLGMQHDVSYMDGHIQVIRDYIDELVLTEILKEIMQEEQYIENLPKDVQESLLEQLERVGETEEDLKKEGWVRIDDEQQFTMSSEPFQPSFEDVGKNRIYRYEYKVIPGKGAPIISTTRNFCERLINLGKLYRREDINNMTITKENDEFGIYDIFKYKGSYGCRHEWVKVPFAKSNVNKKTQNIFSKENQEKKILVGPLMIPNKLIYRYDEVNGEYYVYFSKETIEKLSYKYLKNKYQDQTNLEHSEDIKLEDVVLVESWLVEDPSRDKSYVMTGKQYPKGTWFGTFKVSNDTVWNEWVKKRRVRGLSVEGYFSDKLINASSQKFYYRTTTGGTEIVIDHETFVVFILKDGERTAILPDGNYELSNGKTMRVIDSKAVKGTFEIK